MSKNSLSNQATRLKAKTLIVCTLARYAFCAKSTVLRSRTLIIRKRGVLKLYPTRRLSSSIQQISKRNLTTTPKFVSLRLGNYNNMVFGSSVASTALSRVRHAGLRDNAADFLPALVAASSTTVLRTVTIMTTCHHRRPSHILKLRLRKPCLGPRQQNVRTTHCIQSPSATVVSRLITTKPRIVGLVALTPRIMPTSVVQQLIRTNVQISTNRSTTDFRSTVTNFRSNVDLIARLFGTVSP